MDAGMNRARIDTELLWFCSRVDSMYIPHGLAWSTHTHTSLPECPTLRRDANLTRYGILAELKCTQGLEWRTLMLCGRTSLVKDMTGVL
jgi:hypothetical protein